MFGYLHYFTGPPKGFECLWDKSRRNGKDGNKRQKTVRLKITEVGKNID